MPAIDAMLAALSESEREVAWSEIQTELSQFESAGGFEAPCELIVAAGPSPGVIVVAPRRRAPRHRGTEGVPSGRAGPRDCCLLSADPAISRVLRVSSR